SDRPYLTICRAIEAKTGEPVSSSGDALCPAHEDTRHSLSVNEASDGKVLMKCHAGCSFSDIMASIGLDEKEAFPKSQSNGEISATYDYVDEGGELLFQVVRKRNPKAFLQRTPDGAGGWIWKTKGVRKPLFRLPKVLEASSAGKVVFVTEGEKDAEALERLGFVATTNPGGAEKK